jgi:hypothetical protein
LYIFAYKILQWLPYQDYKSTKEFNPKNGFKSSRNSLILANMLSLKYINVRLAMLVGVWIVVIFVVWVGSLFWVEEFVELSMCIAMLVVQAQLEIKSSS